MIDQPREAEVVKGVKFNLGSDQLEVIGGLLRKSTRFYLEGRLEDSFWPLKEVKINIIANLNKKEKSKLRLIERLFTIELSNRVVLNQTNLGNILELYKITLMTLLDKYGYLIPPKEDKTNLFGQGG